MLFLVLLVAVLSKIFPEETKYVCQDKVFPCKAKTHKYGPDTHSGGKGGLRPQSEWESLKDNSKPPKNKKSPFATGE